MPSVGGVKAGNAYIVIGAIDDTGKMLAKIGRKLQAWGRGFQSLGIDTLFKTAFAAGPMAMGLHTFMKFDDLMKQTQARTGATEGQLKDLSDTARTVGRDLGLTATQVAAIFAELSTRDFGLADMQSMIRPIALLAKATGSGSDTDMQQSTKLMSISLQAFKMDAGEAASIADILTIAANKSNFALDDLREALANIGPLAHNMGLGFKETVAILAQMRNVEIDAASAGIGLRNILLNSANTKEVDKFNKRLTDMGETAIQFTDNMGNLKEGTTLLFEVFAKLQKFGTGTRASLLEEIFGKRAITAAIAAGSSQESFNSLMKSMANAGGEAQRIAHVMESGFGGGFWRKLVTGVHELAISFGTALAPALRILEIPLTKTLTYLNNWIQMNPGIVAGILASTIGVIGFAVSMIALGTALNFAGYAFSAMGLAWTLLQRSLAVAVNLITGITYSVFQLGTALISFSLNAVAATVSALYSMGVALASAVVQMSAFLMASTTSMLPVIGISFAIGAGLAIIIALLTQIPKIWREIKDSITIGLGLGLKLLQDIADIGVFAFTRIADQAEKTGKQLFTSFSLAYQLAASGQMEQAWNLVFLSLKSGWLDVRNVALDIWDEIMIEMGAIGIVFGEIINLMKDLWKSFVTYALTAMDFLVPGMALLVHLIPDVGASDAAQKAIDDAVEGFEDIKSVLRGGRAGAKKKRDKEAADALGEVERAQLEAIENLNAHEGGHAGELSFPEKEKMAQLLGGGGKAVPEVHGKNTPQALMALERYSIEAAKAAYENSLMMDKNGEIQGQQLKALNGILDNTNVLASSFLMA